MLINKTLLLGMLMMFVLLIINCKQKSNRIVDKALIKGCWELTTNSVNYSMITFDGKENALFTSMGDTIFRYKYSIDNNNLILKDVFGKIYKDRIVVLSKDSLIFEGLLLNNDVEQKYIHMTACDTSYN